MLLHIWLQYSVNINILYVLRNQKNSRDWLYHETCFIAVVWNRTHRYLQKSAYNNHDNLHVLRLTHIISFNVHNSHRKSVLSSINLQMRELRLGRMSALSMTWSLVAGGTLGATEMCQPNSFQRACCGDTLDWQLQSPWLHRGVHAGAIANGKHGGGISAGLLLPGVRLFYWISLAWGLNHLTRQDSLKSVVWSPSYPVLPFCSPSRYQIYILVWRCSLLASTPISFTFHWHFPDKSLAYLTPV